MTDLTALSILAIVAASLASAGLALWLLRAWDTGARHFAPPVSAPSSRLNYLFDAHRLVEAGSQARDLLAESAPGERPDNDWARFLATFQARFPALAGLDPVALIDGFMTLGAAGDDDPARLVLSTRAGRVRLTLCDAAAGAADRHALLRAQARLETLARVVDGLAAPVWQRDAEGRILWSNAAFGRLTKDVDSTECPLRGIAPDVARAETPTRVTMPAPQDTGVQGRHWFDVRARAHDEGWLFTATDMDTIVQGEIAQRNFVQTLAKTFAQLSIGLAIFDRNRQLALFNPALIDLTGLPADFLSARPDVTMFFDRLRDRRMMPEPKNYASWRQQMSDLISEASTDHYTDTWTLPSGLTYRVNGRPHPDGAIAFLFEDISAEISLTRRFRSELEQGQCVLDTLEEAVAVFSQQGILTLTNRAYDMLWRCDPGASFAEVDIVHATRIWEDVCDTSPVWAEARQFVTRFGDRAAWEAVVPGSHGESLICRFCPLPGGATVVRFAPLSGGIAPARSPPLRLTRAPAG